MRLALIACTVLLAGGFAASSAAQEPSGADEATVDAGAPPEALNRIRRRLAALPPDDERLLLRVTERVNVYARAQAVAVLEGFNVESWTSLLGGRTGGGIAYGSPTHNEMMNAMTPEFWRRRASSLAGIGIGW